MQTVVLGIETSCDDTAAAICIDGKIVSNSIGRQVEHALYGGVVPELASRLHERMIAGTVKSAIDEAGIAKSDITAVAVTASPGLPGALHVGVSFAKAFAFGLNLPLTTVNHLEAHLTSLFIENPDFAYPFLCLTVSGGHTQITLAKSFGSYEIIGKTIDDAAGEAFDKAARLLGFDYPGGPYIDRYAQEGDPHFHSFPIPQAPKFDFTFSGLKTSFLYYLNARLKENPNFAREHIADLCASLQYRIVNFLLDKFFAAAQALSLSRLAIVGGVAANSGLRANFFERCAKNGFDGVIPSFQYCTDNAAMVAITGYYQVLEKRFTDQYVTMKTS